MYSMVPTIGARHRCAGQQPGAAQIDGPDTGASRDALTVPTRRARDPEIHDRRLVIVADHDVGGLEVAVDDARVMGGDETRDDTPGDAQRAGNLQPGLLLEDRGQIRAVHERHRDVLDAVDFTKVVNPDDVLVRDLAREKQLPLEAAFDLLRGDRIRGDFGPNDLDRHRHTQFGVPGLIDRTHAANAKDPDDVVPGSERLTGLERP